MAATPPEIIAIVVTLIASVTDIRSRKIPNWLTFPGAVVGIACRWLQAGGSGLAAGIQGWLFALAVMLGTRYLAFILGRSGSHAPVGFGDIKLMAVIGACLEPRKFVCQFLVFCALFMCFALLKIATAKTKLSETLKSQMPLAPFMALATICSIAAYKPLSGLLRI